MFPGFDKFVQDILRDSLCRFNCEPIGIAHYIASSVFTAHIRIVVVIESIQMSAYQLIDYIDATAVRPTIRHFGKLTYHIGYSHIVGRTVQIILYFLFGCGKRQVYQCRFYRTKYFIRKLTLTFRVKYFVPVEATLVDLPLTTAEKKVKDYLDRAPHDVTVADVVRQFAKVPYGWADCCSIYVVNELVRRHLYAFNYNNNPNVSREDTARNIMRDANRFTIEPAKAISQDILNEFIEAWKHIFNVVTLKGSNDSTELYRNCKETDDSALNRLLSNYRKLSRKINGCPFESVIDEAITLMEKWTNIRDHKEFFLTITEAKESATALFDRCKNINTFVNDQFEGYQKVKLFIQENRDNFAFLPKGQEEAQNRLCAIHNDMEPWDNMPAYLKMMRNLGGRLEECKTTLIETINTNLYIRTHIFHIISHIRNCHVRNCFRPSRYHHRGTGSGLQRNPVRQSHVLVGRG